MIISDPSTYRTKRINVYIFFNFQIKIVMCLVTYRTSKYLERRYCKLTEWDKKKTIKWEKKIEQTAENNR